MKELELEFKMATGTYPYEEEISAHISPGGHIVILREDSPTELYWEVKQYNTFSVKFLEYIEWLEEELIKARRK
jgi:hypothetical protein